jgi:hypothetical protein
VGSASDRAIGNSVFPPLAFASAVNVAEHGTPAFLSDHPGYRPLLGRVSKGVLSLLQNSSACGDASKI